MRQSLIVGARPLFTKGRPFPRVPLELGRWRIEVENREASRIRLDIRRPTPVNGGVMHLPEMAEIPTPPDFIIIIGPAHVSAEIIEAGRETHISVYAYPIGEQDVEHRADA